jgi:hypothetical protein
MIPGTLPAGEGCVYIINRKYMEDFFNKLIRGESVEPPGPVRRSLLHNFDKSCSIEWIKRDEYYEAMFYVLNKEYLARFKEDGTIVDYLVNMPVDSLPPEVLGAVGSRGEIMNAVSKHSGQKLTYEIIYRDIELNRFMILIDESGSVLSQTAL